jgi:hypothetical protein
LLRIKRFGVSRKRPSANALTRFVATWLGASAVLSALAGLLDLLYRFELLDVIVAITATLLCIMLTIEFPSDPAISVESESLVPVSDSWSRTVMRLVFLRELLQRTLTYPTRTDRAFQDLLLDLARFRGSGRLVSSSARGAVASTELSYESRALLDGTAPATLASLRAVVSELEAL